MYQNAFIVTPEEHTAFPYLQVRLRSRKENRIKKKW